MGLLVLAAVFRFWNYFEIPFTHDEFSALFRTYYGSFDELIDFGVRPDGHPALIQVFTYYYVGLFGDSAWVGKLPYILAGIGAIYFVYKIGAAWFNETVGLVSVSFMVAMQYMVMYSQIARPYITGLFFSMAMVYFWTKLVQKSDTNFKRDAILYVLASAFCAYNHHFSLLFAAIVGVTGILIAKPKMRMQFFGLGLAIFVLYIPHLPIFFHQLSIGGVEGWLGKPQNDFILHYLHYIFHYSTAAVVFAVGLAILAFRNRAPFGKNAKFKIIALLWFLIPFLIGFFYSKFVNGVLQYSVLIFSFPFLLFVLFGWFKPLSEKKNAILVTLIVGVMGTTLVLNRQHYTIFYESIYLKILEEAEELDSSTTGILVDSHHRISDYYVARKGFTQDLIWVDGFANYLDFENKIAELKSNGITQVYFGTVSKSDPILVNILLQYFPALVWQHNFSGGTTAMYSSIDSDDKTHRTILGKISEAKPGHDWFGIDDGYADGLWLDSMLISAEIEWGARFQMDFDSMYCKENDFIDIELQGRAAKEVDDLILVATLENPDGTVSWTSRKFNSFLISEGGEFTIRESLKLSDVKQTKDMQFKTFVWNKGGDEVVITGYTIYRRNGNPNVYGFIEPLY